MDEKEYLKREEKKADITAVFVFLFLIISPMPLVLSAKPGYEFLMSPSFVFIFSLMAIMMIYFVWNERQEKNRDVWLSTEKLMDMAQKLMKNMVLISMAAFIEFPLLMYAFLGYNIFSSEIMRINYIILIIMIISLFPLTSYARKIAYTRYGNSRVNNIDAGMENTKSIVKEALDSLKIEYNEKDETKLGVPAWKFELKNGMGISINSNKKVSRIHIYKITESTEKEERKIEKEILKQLIG